MTSYALYLSTYATVLSGAILISAAKTEDEHAAVALGVYDARVDGCLPAGRAELQRRIAVMQGAAS